MSTARRPTKAKPKNAIDVMVVGAAWTKALRTPAAIVRRAATAALAETAGKLSAEVSILLTNDSALRELNRTYRGKNKPTNVLSFPALTPDELPTRGPVSLGDVAVAYGVTAGEARAEGKTVKAHLSHLVVHGVLHLLGYDHEGDRDAATMERMEKKILAGLGIADPYADSYAQAGPAPRTRRRA